MARTPPAVLTTCPDEKFRAALTFSNYCTSKDNRGPETFSLDATEAPPRSWSVWATGWGWVYARACIPLARDIANGEQPDLWKIRPDTLL